jgi:diguanylate cyclase (GGDEF)-like protein
MGKKLINIYLNTMQKITLATEYEEIKKYEMQLMALVLVPMMMMAALLNLYIGRLLGISVGIIVGFGLMLWGCAAVVLVISRLDMRSTLKMHLLCITLVLATVGTFLTYYEKIGILFWLIIVIMIVFAGNITNFVLHVYLSVMFLALYLLATILFPQKEIAMNTVFDGVLFILMLFIISVSFVSNFFYQKITRNKIEKYIEVNNQKEEVTALYEEISASEEELKVQNEQLELYNEKIQENNDRLEYLAYRDTLTGLPNRKMVMEQLELLININQVNTGRFGVVFIDIDNFKRVNDSYGHNAGDALLIKFIEVLCEGVNPKDMLGRLGGDELTLLIRRNLTEEEMFSYVQKLCNLVDRPFELEEGNIRVTASFGIAVWPIDAESLTDILKAADTAMYKAKESGKNNVQFFHQDMKSEIFYRISLEDKLLKALDNHEFYLEYQPLFAGALKEIHSFEALIRWETAEHEKISPAEFIPFAEEMGIIHEIGEWVIRTACKKINEIKKELQQDIKIAVNVSPIQMQSDEFISKVTNILQEEKVNPQSLELEITESIFINNKQKAIAKITELREMGFSIAMDDFGTGYSSLSYLLELPVDKLKIDRSFISELREGNQKNTIVKAIIEMVHSLDMKVVAEGIENDEQLRYLESEQCDLFQGFHMSRPLSDMNMRDLLVNLKRFC